MVVTDPDNLTCLFAKDSPENGDDLLEFEKRCDRFARSEGNTVKRDKLAELINQIVIAFFPPKKMFLRGQLVSCEGGAEVHFIELARTEKCNKVVAPVPEWIIDPPYRVVLASLSGIQPVGDSWSKQAINFTSDKVLGKLCDAQVTKDHNTDRVYIDILQIKNGSDGTVESISGLLVEKGYAQILRHSDDMEEFNIPQGSLNYQPQPLSKPKAKKNDKPGIDFERLLLLKQFGDTEETPMDKVPVHFDIDQSIRTLKGETGYATTGTDSSRSSQNNSPISTPVKQRKSRIAHGSGFRREQAPGSPLTTRKSDGDENLILNEYSWRLDQLKFRVKQVLLKVSDTTIKEREVELENEIYDKVVGLLELHDNLVTLDKGADVLHPEVALLEITVSWITESDLNMATGVHVLDVIQALFVRVRKSPCPTDPYLPNVLYQAEVKYLQRKTAHAKTHCDKICTLILHLCQSATAEMKKLVNHLLMKWSRSRSVKTNRLDALLDSNMHVRGFYRLVSCCNNLLQSCVDLDELFELTKMWPCLSHQQKFVLVSNILLNSKATNQVSSERSPAPERSHQPAKQTHIGVQTSFPCSDSIKATVPVSASCAGSAQTINAEFQDASVQTQCCGLDRSPDQEADPFYNVKRMLQDLQLQHLQEDLVKYKIRDRLLLLDEADLKQALLESGVQVGEFFEIRNYLRNPPWLQNPPEAPHCGVVQKSKKAPAHHSKSAEAIEGGSLGHAEKSAKTSVVERLFAPDYFERTSASGDCAKPASTPASSQKVESRWKPDNGTSSETDKTLPFQASHETKTSSIKAFGAAAKSGFGAHNINNNRTESPDVIVESTPESDDDPSLENVANGNLALVEQKRRRPPGFSKEPTSSPRAIKECQIKTTTSPTMVPGVAPRSLRFPSQNQIPLTKKNDGNDIESLQDFLTTKPTGGGFQELKMITKDWKAAEQSSENSPSSNFSLNSDDFPDVTESRKKIQKGAKEAREAMKAFDTTNSIDTIPYLVHNPLISSGDRPARPSHGLNMCTNCGSRKHLVYDCPRRGDY